MIKKAFILFTILILSTLLGVYVQKDPGYILISYQHWTIETSLWIGVLILLLAFIFLYALIRGLKVTGSIGSRWRRWRANRRLQTSHSRTSRGLIEFTEGHWLAAEKYLMKALPNSDTPLINYLAAARAAQEQGAYKRRDQYLREAQRDLPDAKIAIELTQAQLQMANNQFEQALATLQHLHSMVPKHAYVLKLLHSVYVELKDWPSLKTLVKELRRHRVLSEEEIIKTEYLMYRGLLQQAEKLPGAISIQEVWKTFPKSMTRDPLLVADYAKLLIERRAGKDAEQILRDQLKRQWNDQLAELYGLAQGEEPTKQLGMAEFWLKSKPNNPVLLLCAGRLCLRLQLWGKARTYLENSLAIDPRADTFAELAQLLAQLGEQELATTYYREGLERANEQDKLAKLESRIPAA